MILAWVGRRSGMIVPPVGANLWPPNGSVKRLIKTYARFFFPGFAARVYVRLVSLVVAREWRMARVIKAVGAKAGKDALPRGARERILDTAEQLFAREGVMAVTLRSIASAADVNVAAVNYYFGSKEKLFEEMFLRRVAPLNEERLTRLQDCMARAGGRASLEAIVQAYVLPATELADVSSASARAIIVQYSLGRILAMPEANHMLVRYYDRLRKEFVAALQQALPDLAPQEVVWRYYWMGGCLMCSLAVPPGMVEDPAGGTEAAPSGRGALMTDSLIGFLVTGFRFGVRKTGPRAVA